MLTVSQHAQNFVLMNDRFTCSNFPGNLNFTVEKNNSNWLKCCSKIQLKNLAVIVPFDLVSALCAHAVSSGRLRHRPGYISPQAQLNFYPRCHKPLWSPLARTARSFHGTAGTDVFFLAVSISSPTKAIFSPAIALLLFFPSLSRRRVVISQHSGLEEELQRLQRANPETICKQRHGSTQSAFFFFCYSFSHARL